jgi:small ligand-binding sensory domain FIST
LKVATGLAIGKIASADLAANAVESAMLKANIHAPSSVLLFLTSEFAADPQSAIKAAAKAASCTQIIGCSATGIFTEEDWVIDSPAAAAMVFSDLNFGYSNENNDDLLLTLTAPNAINTTWLNTAGVRFGGVSGDALGQGQFSVWQNGKGNTQGYCEVTLENTCAAVGASHGLQLISAPRRITKCNGNDLLSLANIPALNTLFSACKKQDISIANDDIPYHQLMAVHASKASQIERGDFNLASLIIASEDAESITLTKALKEGDWLSWAIRDIDAAQIDIVKTASMLRRQLDSEPAFGLLFSCLGRGPYFYNGQDQDLALIKTLFPDLPLIGFYGNGEIAPIGGLNELLQYSAVLGLFAKSNVVHI